MTKANFPRLQCSVLGVAALAIAGCDTSTSIADDAAAASQEELFRSSYTRQCETVATVQGVPDEAAKPICECTVEKVFDGRTKEDVDAMSEEETLEALNSCIDRVMSEQAQS